jgi:hypothetical protein
MSAPSLTLADAYAAIRDLHERYDPQIKSCRRYEDAVKLFDQRNQEEREIWKKVFGE